MDIDDFHKGQRVRYVPQHANGDRNHPDCEDGVVSSVGGDTVFVKYDLKTTIQGTRSTYYTMTTGDEPYTAQGTYPEDLIRL